MTQAVQHDSLPAIIPQARSNHDDSSYVHCSSRRVLGQWKLTVETPNGTTNPILTINAADAGYSGTYVGPRGSFELKEIKVEGNTFSFPLTITIPIGKMDFQYTGKVEGDTLSGSIGNAQGTIPFVGVRVK